MVHSVEDRDTLRKKKKKEKHDFVENIQFINDVIFLVNVISSTIEIIMLLLLSIYIHVYKRILNIIISISNINYIFI